MFDDSLRRVVPYGWALAGVVVVYVAGVFALRNAGSVRLPSMPRTAEPGIPREYTGSESGIAHFYTGSPVIVRGESATLCYGVRNVRALRLEPAVETLGPSVNRCFAVSPRETTSYTLTAEGADGRVHQASFAVQVDPPPPRFTMLATGEKQVVRGDRWSFCYSVENASSVRLEPMHRPLPLGAKRCIMLFPVQTTQFRLVATGERNMTAVEKFGVKVVRR